MATHSNVLAWAIPSTEEPGGATVHGAAKSWTWLSGQTTSPLSSPVETTARRAPFQTYIYILLHTHTHTHTHTHICQRSAQWLGIDSYSAVPCTYTALYHILKVYPCFYIYINLTEQDEPLTPTPHWMRAQSLQLCPTLCGPMDCVAHQASLSMGFSRQEYWSGLPRPPPDLPNPGIKPTSLMSPALAGGFLTTSATRNNLYTYPWINTEKQNYGFKGYKSI